MRLTPVLYVRSWLARLHPPNPTTTPQENQRLLSLLTSSFQRRLDEAHPPIWSKNKTRTTMPSCGPVIDNSSARATMDHLQSLLHHPLLAHKTVFQTNMGLAGADAARMMDQAMLCGKADLDVLRRCMHIYTNTLENKNVAVNDEYRLGRRISAWFTSSDAATKEKFLSSPGVLSDAVPILYADGLEEVVWGWLEMLYARNIVVGNSQKRDNPQHAIKPLKWVLQETHLTYLMIKEALREGHLDAAILQLIQASAYMQSVGSMSPKVRSSKSWQAAVNAITVSLLRRRHQHGLSAHLFDHFLDHRSSWSDPNNFSFELICLYHPTRPTAKELVTALGQGKEQVQTRFDRIISLSQPAKKIMLNSLIDGAQLILKQPSASERYARLILDLITAQFPTLSDVEGDEVTQKRIRSVRHTITLQQFMPLPIGIA